MHTAPRLLKMRRRWSIERHISWPLECSAVRINDHVNEDNQEEQGRDVDGTATFSFDAISHTTSHDIDRDSTSTGSTNPSLSHSIPSSWEDGDDSNDDLHECSLDLAHDCSAQFHKASHDSDDFPTPAQMREAGEMLIYDANGHGRTFRSLYEGEHVIGDRQLVLFVRHFYCGACQSYLKALTASITPSTYFTMPVPTSIIIIGCGAPSLIPQYRAHTGCPFPLFADPTRRLYRTLGMSWSLHLGRRRPEYMRDTAPLVAFAAQLGQMARSEPAARFRGGHWLQVGGEFLFVDGALVWCHRMRNLRGHAEMGVLRRVLEIDR